MPISGAWRSFKIFISTMTSVIVRDIDRMAFARDHIARLTPGIDRRDIGAGGGMACIDHGHFRAAQIDRAALVEGRAFDAFLRLPPADQIGDPDERDAHLLGQRKAVGGVIAMAWVRRICVAPAMASARRSAGKTGLPVSQGSIRITASSISRHKPGWPRNVSFIADLQNCFAQNHKARRAE